MQQQSKLGSFTEALVNVLIGLAVAMLAQMWFFAEYHVAVSTETNIKLTIFMTVISVVRSYALRRAFNSEFWKDYKYGKASAERKG